MNRKILLNNVLIISLSLTACFCLLTKSEICACGIREGLLLCANTIIPSLFPFMTASVFIVKSGLAEFFGRLTGRLTLKLFRLPPVTSSVILMSLVGGYPVGAKMTCGLLESGKITPYQALRLNLFCVNAGPAFTVGTVGCMLLSSERAGVVIYASTVISALLMGIFSGLIFGSDNIMPKKCDVTVIRNPITAFSESVNESVKSIISVCSWVLVFSCIIKYIRCAGENGYVIAACSLLEVTSAVKMSIGVLPLPAIAAIISFGGLSVHCQIYPYISKSGIGFKYFYTSRAVCAAVSAVICALLLKIFPCEIQTVSSVGEMTVSAYSVSLPAALALIMMCCVLIFDIDTGKKIC